MLVVEHRLNQEEALKWRMSYELYVALRSSEGWVAGMNHLRHADNACARTGHLSSGTSRSTSLDVSAMLLAMTSLDYPGPMVVA